jgi:hypothetical protein
MSEKLSDRDLAIAILQDCALRYVNVESQADINRAIDLATLIIGEHRPRLAESPSVAEAVEREREACLTVVYQSAWRHEGDDAYSQGLDKGAREQLAACASAIADRNRSEG